MIKKNSLASDKDLRSFGLVMAAFFALFLGIIPLLKHHPLKRWPLVVAVLFFAFAWLAPKLLRPLHTAWLRFGHIMGAINSRIILALVYFLLFVPFGVLRRLFGKNKMDALDPELKSYRDLAPVGSKPDMTQPY